MNFSRLLSIIISSLISISLYGQDVDPSLFEKLEYRNIGPTRGGRATTVTGIESQPGTFFMGSTGGGLWKTTDYGSSWKNVSDGYFASPSLGAVRVSQSNPDIVYAGTGSDGIRSNVITGKGVYKSSDQGKTWEFIGLKESGHIGAVEIHPDNPDVVFVAAIGNGFAKNNERGVFKSTDGGQTWDNVLFHSDSIGAVDLDFAPDNPDIIYATLWRVERKPWTILSGSTEGGIYKSTDGGESWSKLSNGLPDGIVGKIDLAVSPSQPSRLWALVEAPSGKGGVYKSDDYGASFELISTKKELLDRPFYYCNIDANPQNADNIFVNATRFWKSTDGGKKWSNMRTPHGDNHDMWIHPQDSMLWVQCNDGGANVTRDGGKTWSSILNQSTAELYQVEVDDQFPYWLYAGQQDNSTISVPSTPPYSPASGPNGFWMAVGGCETGPAVPKPGNPDIVYANCKGRFGVYNKKTGQEQQYYVGASNMYGHNPKDLRFRFQRVSPIHVSPHDPDVVYHTSQYVHKTIDDGKTWEIISGDLTAFDSKTQVISGDPITRDITGEEFHSTIYAIRESKIEKGLIWVGANDGPVHVTRDGGTNWTDVTPDVGPFGRVDCVEPSPHDPSKAYVSILRYQLGDWKPYIFRTNDYGQSWTLITSGENGIPEDFPTRVVREDPENEGILFAGTEFGMYISFDDGNKWHPFQQNLPITPITDIRVHQNDLVISTMGRGFWILDNVNAVHDVKNHPGGSGLVSVHDSYRMRYRGNGSSIPSYPSASATIDYYLDSEPENEISVKIVADNGTVLRSFTSGTKEDKNENPEPSMATGFYIQGAEPGLKKDAGAHRITWDLRHMGAWHWEQNRSGRNGPMVTPGSYKVQLVVNEDIYEKPLTIMADPRVVESGMTQENFDVQEQLALQVRDLLSEARMMANEVKSRKDELENQKSLSKKQRQEVQALEVIQYELLTEEGRYMQPKLVDQISYLNSMINRADQVPGKDAFERYSELRSKLDNLKPQWDKYLGPK